MTYVSGIIITNADYLKVGIGYKLAIKTLVLPTNATNKTLSWRSNTPDIASVDSVTGIVTGKKAGIAQIYVCATDGSGVERTINVIVEELIPVTQVEIYPDGVIEAKVGDTITNISVGNIQPSNATMMELIWSSSDEEIATVDSYGVVKTHKDGVVQITATGVGGTASDSCTINVDSRTKVTIEKDGDYNKVVFENGKVWHCINCDMIYDQDNAFNEELTDRRCLDLYEDPVNCVGYKTYTDDELKFLYTVDPCGVAKYVQMYANQYEDLEDTLAYKDSIFYKFFGRQPQYFARNLAGTWYVTTDKNNLYNVMSESETIFGAHTIYDATTLLSLAGFVVDILGTICGSSFFQVGGVIKKSIAKVIKTFVTMYILGETVIKNQIASYVVGYGIEKAFEETSLDWLSGAVSLYDRLEQLSFAITDKPGMYLDFIHYFATNNKYRVCVKLRSNEVIEMKDLEEAINTL